MKYARQLMLYALTAIIFLALGFVLATSIVPRNTVSAIGETSPEPLTQNVSLTEQEQLYQNIYDSVAPSVVSVVIEAHRNQEPLWSRIGSGSGFVIDKEGHIVTNYHVVSLKDELPASLGSDAEGRISVAFFDGTIVHAELVGGDPQSDLAVLKVDIAAERLYPVNFGDSEAVHEGQFVFAIGNPFANDWTLTSGIVSAKNRSIPSLDTFNIGGVIQTDTAINPGNSGGPLVNLAAEVVGVNAQIESGTGVNSGVGFAIPSNLVVKVTDMLIHEGAMHYSYMGINSVPIDLSMIDFYNLPNNIRGVPISFVEDTGPAASAGLHNISQTSVDIITAIDGLPISNFAEMIGYLSLHTSPGDTVNLTVYRDGKILELPLVLSDRP